MHGHYLGQISFDEALAEERRSVAEVLAGAAGRVLGFETGPVITLGVRGSEADILWPASQLAARHFTIKHLERGGQATLHNPGQLVIFPIVSIEGLGARQWVELLLSVTKRTLAEFGKEVHCRAGQPGLFSEVGKVVSVGVRLQKGVSSHGLAINVSNDLSDFAAIKACGVMQAPMDQLGGNFALPEIFAAWLRNFRADYAHRLTSPQNLMNLGNSSRCALIAQLVRALP